MYILVNLLFCVTYIYAVDVVGTSYSSFSNFQNIHKVVSTSKTEFVRPIKSCEITKASDIGSENTNNIVYACNRKLKRHYLISVEKANYSDGRAFKIR